jgi:hypothetical protein
MVARIRRRPIRMGTRLLPGDRLRRSAEHECPEPEAHALSRSPPASGSAAARVAAALAILDRGYGKADMGNGPAMLRNGHWCVLCRAGCYPRPPTCGSESTGCARILTPLLTLGIVHPPVIPFGGETHDQI